MLKTQRVLHTYLLNKEEMGKQHKKLLEYICFKGDYIYLWNNCIIGEILISEPIKRGRSLCMM